MARDINITATCAHCGEILDTNEADYLEDVVDGELEGGMDLTIGTQHECFLELEAHRDDPERAECDPRTIDEIIGPNGDE